MEDDWAFLADVDNSEVFPTQPQTITSPPSPPPTPQFLHGFEPQESDAILYNIPGPAGVLQAAMRRKRCNNQGEHSRSTQEFIREVLEEAEADDSFEQIPWLSAMHFAYPDGGNSNLGQIPACLKKGKIDKVVGVIKSCVPNRIGELNVVLKDTTGSISGTIHYKLLEEVKGICVGTVLVLHNVSVFSPKHSSTHFLNITKKNLVKVFFKDGESS